MNFPVISKQAQKRVQRQILRAPGVPNMGELMVEFDRIRKKDAVIDKFFRCICRHSNYGPTEVLYNHALGYGITVYRLVEEEMRLRRLQIPTVSQGVKAPLRTEIRRKGFDSFANDEAQQIFYRGDKCIVGASGLWIHNFEAVGDTESAIKVLFVGVCVYRLLKSQWEADALKIQLEGKI